MRLSPPISVLTILAATFAWMGVAPSRGKSCFQTPRGGFTLANWATWLNHRIAGSETPCDPWTSIEPSKPIEAITVSDFAGGLAPAGSWHEVTLLRTGEVADYVVSPAPEDFDPHKQRSRLWANKAALFSKVEALVSPLETNAQPLAKLSFGKEPNCRDYLYDGGGAAIWFGWPKQADWKIWVSTGCQEEPMKSAVDRAIKAYDIVDHELSLKKLSD